jgi:hypothetical protein
VVAIERYRKGESVEAICVSLKRSRSWFYKWLDRADQAGPEWYEEQIAPAAAHGFGSCDSELRQRIVTTRGRLEAKGSFVSAQMIAWELESEKSEPPSISTIKRILKVVGLTAPTRRAPKGIKYPTPLAIAPGMMHQADSSAPSRQRHPVLLVECR